MTVALSVSLSALILAAAFVWGVRQLTKSAKEITNALATVWEGAGGETQTIDLDEIYKANWTPEGAELVLEDELGVPEDQDDLETPLRLPGTDW